MKRIASGLAEALHHSRRVRPTWLQQMNRSARSICSGSGVEAKTAQQLELERWVVEGSQLPCVRQRAQEVGVSSMLAVWVLM